MKKNSNLKKLLPEEIMKPEFLKDYEEYTDLIWHELKKLNAQFKVLQKFLEFPSFFLPHGSQEVFMVLKHSLFEAIIMRLWKLSCDTDSRSFPITRLKNEVQKHINGKYLQELRNELKKVKFDPNIKTRIGNIRKKILGHMNMNVFFAPSSPDFKISVEESKKIYNRLCELFSILCFGRNKNIEHPSVNTAPFLDFIAKHSDVLRMQEEDPYWEISKQRFTKEELKILNSYRRKFGLSEV